MSYNFFDPSAVNQLAKFQGTMAGVQAGNAYYCGPAMAVTSIFNQSGHYAVQDAKTGMITIKKLGDESLYTKNWYDQGTDTTFDFTSKSGTFDSTKLNQHMSAAEIAAIARGQVE